jgi:hypothetical protein
VIIDKGQPMKTNNNIYFYRYYLIIIIGVFIVGGFRSDTDPLTGLYAGNGLTIPFRQTNFDKFISYKGGASGANVIIKSRTLSSLSLPIRAAFYYPWYPGGWNQKGIYPETYYHPTLDFFDPTDSQIIREHKNAL